MLAHQLAQASRDLRLAVYRLLKVRRPLPADIVLKLAAPPEEHEPLITQCVAYGEPLRIASLVRASLGQGQIWQGFDEVEVDEDTHFGLAEVHRTMDGASHPAQTANWQGMAAWLEKVHHLARAGERGATEWSKQCLPRRELYWDRARYLSIERRDYMAAAQVYSECLEHFPDDDYALHYRAYNHQRAVGQVTAKVLVDYEEAIERVPDNPWWNSRKITALIEARRPVEARRAWARAIEAIDPEGERLEGDPWLFSHFHYWVARAWLESGAWCTARSILDLAPLEVIESLDRRRNIEVAAMRQRIEEAERREWARFETWMGKQCKQSAQPWQSASTIVTQLRARIPNLPPPIADDGEDGPCLTWSRPGVYVELEVLERGLVDWFARDRVDDRRDGVDDAVSWNDDRLLRWLEQASRE